MKNISYAFRYTVKSGANNLTRIVSLTLGLAVSLLVFSYIAFEASYDRFMPDRERIYQIWAGFNGDVFNGVDPQMFGPVGPALMEVSPQVDAATRYKPMGRHPFRTGDDQYFGNVVLADSMFFDVLDYGVLRGDPRKVLADRNRVMLSESLSRTIFGDGDPMGEILHYDGQHGKLTLTVSGIFRDIPRNTQLGRFDVLMSFDLAETMGFYTGWGGGSAFPTFLKLKPGADIAQVEGQFNGFIDKMGARESMNQYGMSYFFAPLTDSKTIGSEFPHLSLILAVIAMLTLFVAAMNYVLISISMLIKRGRTTAMLKCNGARRRDIFSMFLWETFFILAASLALAALIILAAEGAVDSLLQVSMKELFAPARIWAPLLVVLAMFCLSGVIPARIFASVPVSSAFKGTKAGPRWWKKTLLLIQITIAALVVTLLIVTVRQFGHMAYGDYGYDTENLLFTSFTGTPSNLEAYKNEIASIPDVTAVGAAYDLPIRGYSGQPAYDDTTREMLFSARTGIIHSDYLPAMGMRFTEGRNFRSEEPAGSVIVNERYVAERGWPQGTATGRRIIDRENQTEPYTIVGVVSDFWMGYGGSIMPVVFHNAAERLTKPDRNYRSGYVMIRMREASPEAIETLTQHIGAFYPHDFEVEAYDTYMQEQLFEVKMFRNITTLVTAVALAIVLMGLIGYISDEINRRRKEIAIRKVNGAGRAGIIALIARDAAVMTVPGVAAGAAGAWLLGRAMLTMFPQKAPLHWWIFLLGALAVAATVYAVALMKTWRVAGSNPAESIKSE